MSKKDDSSCYKKMTSYQVWKTLSDAFSLLFSQTDGVICQSYEKWWLFLGASNNCPEGVMT